MKEPDPKLPKFTEEDERQLAEFEAMARAMDLGAATALAKVLDVSDSTISQIRSRKIKPKGQWERLMNRIAVTQPSRMRRAFALLREQGNLELKEDKPALEPWAVKLLEDLSRLPIASRNSVLAALEKMLEVVPGGKVDYR